MSDELIIPRYKEKPKNYWTNENITFKSWISEKYKYCLHFSLKAIAEIGDKEKGFIYPEIFEILTRVNIVRKKTIEIDASQLHEAYKLFAELISNINKYIVFIPSIQTFCAFCNLSVRELNELADGVTDDSVKMQDVIQQINNYFTTSLSYAGQLGFASPSLVSAMLKQDGQGLITTAKDIADKAPKDSRMPLDDIAKKVSEIKKNK